MNRRTFLTATVSSIAVIVGGGILVSWSRPAPSRAQVLLDDRWEKLRITKAVDVGGIPGFVADIKYGHPVEFRELDFWTTFGLGVEYLYQPRRASQNLPMHLYDMAGFSGQSYEKIIEFLKDADPKPMLAFVTVRGAVGVKEILKLKGLKAKYVGTPVKWNAELANAFRFSAALYSTEPMQAGAFTAYMAHGVVTKALGFDLAEAGMVIKPSAGKYYFALSTPLKGFESAAVKAVAVKSAWPPDDMPE